MSFSRPIQWYHSHVDPIWPDGALNAIGKSRLNMYARYAFKGIAAFY